MKMSIIYSHNKQNWPKSAKMHQLWPWIFQAVVGLLQCSRPFWMTKMAKNQQKKKLLQLAQRRPRYGQKTDKIVGKLVKNLLNGPTSRVSCLMLLNLNLMACDSSKWPCSPQNYIFMCQNHTVNHILTKNPQKLTFWFSLVENTIFLLRIEYTCTIISLSVYLALGR